MKMVVEDLYNKERNEIDFKKIVAALTSNVDLNKLYENIKQKDTD